ncbi:TPA: hypothetical protein LA462_000304 [Clostridium botulinum]|nr:hypothetical protein [Clostridium botulinum]
MDADQKYEYWNNGFKVLVLLVLIISLGMLKIEINEVNKGTETIQTQGKVIACTTNESVTIFSLIGLVDSLEYKTIIKVDNEILESPNKEVYYLCKDKIDSNVDLQIETFDGKASEIKEVLNN